MAAGPTVSLVSRSTATFEYFYVVRGLSPGKNSLVLTGVAPNDFIPDPLTTTVRPLGVAAVCTVSFDEPSLVIDPSDTTQVLIDVYADSNTVSCVVELVGGGVPAEQRIR